MCIVGGCGKEYKARGYCVRHYTQFLRFGKTKRTYADPNEFIIEGDTCRIKLYDIRGNEKAETFIDAEDAERCRPYKWCLMKTGYVMSREKHSKKTLRLQHHILGIAPQKRIQVDHEDRNKLNNRRSNFRIATPFQNQWNVGLSKNNASGYKGVSWAKCAKKWIAQIVENGNHHFLGYYRDKVRAAMAYNVAAHKYFGEFAYLNTIQEV